MELQWISSLFVISMCVTVNGAVLQVKINFQKPLHTVSDAFVSFAFESEEMFALQPNMNDKDAVRQTFQMLSPAYIKMTQGVGMDVHSQTSLITTTNWINSNGLTPVWSLPYSIDWSAREAVRWLAAFKQSGSTHCVWQLGKGLNVSDPMTYLDDLAMLREISDAFDERSWDVIGADISALNTPDAAQFYVDISQHMVGAIGWTRSSTYASPDRPCLGEDPTTIRAIENCIRPIWLNFHRDEEDYHTDITRNKSERKALNWAHNLGVNARNGFAVTFKHTTLSDWIQPTFEMVLSMLHKKLMGNKVFEAQLKADGPDVSVFAHCGRNISGSFTVMAVNSDGASHTVTSTLPSGTTGHSVQEYVLNIDSRGLVCMNNKPLYVERPMQNQFVANTKRRFARLVLPAKSVVFWVFPQANVNECYDQPPTENSIPSAKSVSQKLLKELLLDTTEHCREKRDSRTNDEAQRTRLKPTESEDIVNQSFFKPMRNVLLKQMLSLVKELQQVSKSTDQRGSIKNDIQSTGEYLSDSFSLPNRQKIDKPFDIRQKCKVLSVNLEQHCLRDPHGSLHRFTNRKLHTKSAKRMRRNAQWNANDIQTNMITKDTGSAAPPRSMLSNIFWQDEYGIVHDIPLEFTGTDDVAGASVRKPEVTTEGIGPTDGTDKYGSPKFMRSFSKSVVSLLDLVNQNVAAWWTAMS